MGIPIHPIFDITTQAGRDAERKYLHLYMRTQLIITCIVWGCFYLFCLFIIVVILYQHAS